MKKTIYIIPGWEETSRRKPYQLLSKIAEKEGYNVIFKNVDWTKPLSPQIFPTSKNDVIFGFSLGAILAWLVAQKYQNKHLILASMTPIHNFTDPKIRKALIEITGSRFVKDIIKNLKTKTKSKKKTVIYGDKEDEKGDILIPKTQHQLTDQYIKIVGKLL